MIITLSNKVKYAVEFQHTKVAQKAG